MALADAVEARIIPEWTLGDRLAKARRLAGLEQGDVAELLEVSRATISAWERDETQPRNLLTIAEAWAAHTNVEVGWLLGIRTGSFAIEGLPASPAPELPFPPITRHLAAVATQS